MYVVHTESQGTARTPKGGASADEDEVLPPTRYVRRGDLVAPPPLPPLWPAMPTVPSASAEAEPRRSEEEDGRATEGNFLGGRKGTQDATSRPAAT